jgi:predicted nucleic acid-binding protein
MCVDACSLINLAAIGEVGSLAARFGRRLLVVENAAGESLFVRSESHPDARIRIDLAELESISLLEDELETYVALSASLDDGEAATLAVAYHRRLVAVTDDRRAIREATRLEPSVTTMGTAAAVRVLAERECMSMEAIGHLLRRIEVCARFRPRVQDPDWIWWEESTRSVRRG